MFAEIFFFGYRFKIFFIFNIRSNGIQNGIHICGMGNQDIAFFLHVVSEKFLVIPEPEKSAN